MPRDAFDYITPFAGKLDGGFNCFCATVHWQAHFITRQFGYFLVEKRQLIVAECPRGEGDFLCLLLHGSQDAGMDMSLVQGGIGAKAVKILLSIHIPHPNTLSAI